MNGEKRKAVNFTAYCKNATLEEIQFALQFYDEEFEPEKVLEYFENWEIKYDDSKYKNGIILINTHSTSKWKTTITINDNVEYTYDGNNNTWIRLPETFSEFISDMLRETDFDLFLSDIAFKKIYG